MKEVQEGPNKIKILITIIFMIFFIILVTNGTKIIKKPTDVYVVANVLYHMKSLLKDI